MPHQECYFYWYDEGWWHKRQCSPWLCKFDLIRSIETKHYKTSESTKYYDAWVVMRFSCYDSATIPLQNFTGYLLSKGLILKFVFYLLGLTINSPAYLVTLLNSYKLARTLWSTNNNLLQIHRTRTVTGTLAFRCAAPTLWNSLPADITLLHSLDCFLQKLSPLDAVCHLSGTAHSIDGAR